VQFSSAIPEQFTSAADIYTSLTTGQLANIVSAERIEQD